MIDIQAMRELLNKASKGDWLKRTYVVSTKDTIVLTVHEPADAAFIAASHNNMAELLRLAEIGLKAQEQRKDGAV